jgi:hypothetical protein
LGNGELQAEPLIGIDQLLFWHMQGTLLFFLLLLLLWVPLLVFSSGNPTYQVSLLLNDKTPRC